MCFCSSKNGLTPKIHVLCLVINRVLFNLLCLWIRVIQYVETNLNRLFRLASITWHGQLVKYCHIFRIRERTVCTDMRREREKRRGKKKKKSTSPTCPLISFLWWLHYLPHTGLGWHHFFVQIQDSQRVVCRRTSKPLGFFFILSRRVFLNQHRERMLLSQAFYLTKHAGVTSGSWRAHADSSQSCLARKRRLLFRSETLSAFDVIAMKEWKKIVLVLRRISSLGPGHVK